MSDALDQCTDIRLIQDDLVQGKQNSNNAWKITTDPASCMPAFNNSSYRVNFEGNHLKSKLVFGTPHLPRYSMNWGQAGSSYAKANKDRDKAYDYFTRRNIVVTEPKHKEPLT